MKKVTNKGAVMRKKVTLILLLGFLSLCTQTQNDVEKIMEDGVEVIINHNKPYIVEGNPATLSIEEEFIIDLEKDNIAVLGLADIWGFDVDSEGNIYFFKSPLSQGDLVFKFDPKGNFVSSFARRGQGPGEVENPSYQKINNRNELPIIESGLSKIMLFNKDGSLIKEIHLDIDIGFMGNMVYPLENGNYLIRRSLRSEIEGRLDFILSLFDPEFNEIKELDRFELIQPIRADKVRLPMHVSVWCVSKDYIYVGNEENGYEIRVYDLKGNLQRKIRKQYKSVKVSGEFKQYVNEKLEHTPPVLRDKIYFPDYFPAFQFIFTDDEGSLFVMTFEKGQNPKDYNFDIFNQEGLFIGSISLDVFLNDPFFTPGAPLDSWITKKGDRLYVLRMKSSGYKEFVVYKAAWQ